MCPPIGGPMICASADWYLVSGIAALLPGGDWRIGSRPRAPGESWAWRESSPALLLRLLRLGRLLVLLRRYPRDPLHLLVRHQQRRSSLGRGRDGGVGDARRRARGGPEVPGRLVFSSLGRRRRRRVHRRGVLVGRRSGFFLGGSTDANATAPRGRPRPPPTPSRPPCPSSTGSPCSASRLCTRG